MEEAKRRSEQEAREAEEKEKARQVRVDLECVASSSNSGINKEPGKHADSDQNQKLL